ncbi:uncharacterized protein [Littorina saxatilis]|uniref:uncharacterized protein n=1 Tax=Littorina saxatilis TaxID=31220 RepID=UPI0038B53D33
MAPGASCCVVNCTNASHNWKGQKKNESLRFFRIPKVKTREGEHVKAVTERRRRAWVAAIRRTNITFEHSSDGFRVCSRHFHKGEPAYEMAETDPDWAPSLHLGHEEIKQTNLGRHERQKGRSLRKHASLQQNEVDGSSTTLQDSDCLSDGVEEELLHEQSVQVDFTSEPITALNDEVNCLREENQSLKELLDAKQMNQKAFEGNDDMVKYYTGLPSFAMLTVLLGIVQPHLPQGNRRVLSPFKMLLITLMRLRLNLPVQHIAYMFGLHRSTVTNTFVETMNVLYERLVGLIHWPDRQSLHDSMPHEFIEAFGRNVAVIIDCFEIFIEKPSNCRARSETWSNYKHNHTMKYLIGITPQGVISFLSKGWGGKASDKMITENSGFLNHLLPGDKVLADRGFDIEEIVGLACAEVKIPAFTRGKCQMHSQDIEQTRKIAHLRIHVERVIGNVVMKYTILSSTIPINLILPCEGEDVTFLDKIVVVCCALTNMCPSVV